MLARFKALQVGLILAGGVCLAQQALALRLGELTVESNLAEPLDATIELLDVAGLDPSQISISLGTEEEYAIASAEFSPQVTQVQFAVSVDGDTGSVHLTTPDIVDEPFLDLLLNASWPEGSLQREFVVLLHLPGTAASATDPLTIPAVTSPSPPEADADLPRDNDEARRSSDSQSYAVADGDSMWEIASRTRPSADVSMQQMMLAIQRANEDAFINNNINRVLAGRVLRIPTLEEIKLVDQAAAVTQISQQTQELGLQPLAVNRTAGNTSPSPLQDELTVLTDDQDAAAAAGSGDLEATLAALENEMMLSEESLDRARLENAELTSRFKMLEEEMDLLQNIIVVEDARIAQLQAELAEQAETTEQALATTEDASSVLAAQQSVAQPGMAGNVPVWLQNTAVMMGVIFALLLVILGYLFWQRRRMNAAVYAFDSGIPELETVDNSSFAPAAKSGGGTKGWFSRRTANTDNDGGLVADADRARDAVAVNLHGSTTTAPDTLVDIDLGETSVKPRYLDEEQMVNAVNQAGASDEFSDGSVQNESSATFARTMTPGEDEAELADELIAEAKGISGSTDEQSSRVYERAADLAEAEREAEALAELVTPDVAFTDTEIPESFEFTLKTAPEALAEETQAERPDDMESVDFQLSESSAAQIENTETASTPAAREMSDEELQLSTMLLDEEEGDFHAGAPMNECDTKLDLAVAYEAMGDIEGAIEILGEVIADGDSAQVAEANRLKGLWQNS